MSGVLHSNESQGDSPNKIGLVGSARCDGGGAFVFYRYFSCSFVSARGLRLSGAGGDVGVGYAVLIFEWLTRVATGSNFFLGLSLLLNETTPSNLGIFCGLRPSAFILGENLKTKFKPLATRVNHSNIKTA